jgi:O-antigen/teichoic acid export membrane protein
MLKKIGTTFAFKAVTAVMNLLVIVALSQGLGTEGKGEASLIITNIAITMIFCNMVGGSTLVYLVPRYNLAKLLVPSFAWSLLSCAACALVIGLFMDTATIYAVHIFFLSLLSAVLSINLTVLLGKQQVGTNNFISFLQSLITLAVVVTLVFGYKEKNLQSYIISLYAAFGACVLISILLLIPHAGKKSSDENDPSLKELFTLGLVNQLGHVLQFLSLRLSYYILTTVKGDAALGVYSNGTSLAESVWLISNSIAMVQYSFIANNDDLNGARMLTLRLVKLALLGCALALVPLVLLPAEAYTWIFGKGFAGVSSVIVLLAPGVLMYNIALITGHYFSGIGKYHVNTIANGIGLAVTAILSFALWNRYSPGIAALIASVSYTATSLFVIVCFLKESRFRAAQLLPTYSDISELQKQLRSRIATKRK